MSENVYGNGAGLEFTWSENEDGSIGVDVGKVQVLVKPHAGERYLAVFNGWARVFEKQDVAMGESALMAQMLDYHMSRLAEVQATAQKRGIVLEA